MKCVCVGVCVLKCKTDRAEALASWVKREETIHWTIHLNKLFFSLSFLYQMCNDECWVIRMLSMSSFYLIMWSVIFGANSDLNFKTVSIMPFAVSKMNLTVKKQQEGQRTEGEGGKANHIRLSFYKQSSSHARSPRHSQQFSWYLW